MAWNTLGWGRGGHLGVEEINGGGCGNLPRTGLALDVPQRDTVAMGRAKLLD